ncbi:MAG: DUF4234 domain-containing protein [Solirubrobacterales bacterium]|nr:DUF4234 domain-containing protein [Solirubrobacterales bacterium]
MAEQVQIVGTEAQGKIRNPLGVIGLTIITFGIYALVWYYKINKEMAAMGRAQNTSELGESPGTSLLAVTLGWFLIIPPFVSTYRTCQRINKSSRTFGVAPGVDAALVWLIYIFVTPIAQYLMQSDMNKTLTAQAGGSPSPQVGSDPAVA